jgi:hypothetical protein
VHDVTYTGVAGAKSSVSSKFSHAEPTVSEGDDFL